MKIKACITSVIGFILISSIIVIQGCKENETPGVSDKEVVVGITTPLSGPALLWGNTGLGAKAWAEYINSKGGINGRRIRVIIKDDGYNPEQALANLEDMKGQIFAVVGLLGTAVIEKCRNFFPDNKLLLINAYGNTRIWAHYPRKKLRYIFISYPDYEDEAEFMTKFAYRRLGSRLFSVFYQDDDYGRLGLSGVEKAIRSLAGSELAGKISYRITRTNLKYHALKLKNIGADTLILYPSPTHGAMILKEIAKLDYRPKILTSFPLGDPVMFMKAKDYWEGVYSGLPAQISLPGFEKEADKVLRILKMQHPGISSDTFALYGAVSMMHFAQGLRNAGKKLTTESMIKGMESIRQWRPEGMGGAVTYGADRHHGLNGIRMGLATKGKIKPVSKFYLFKPHF